LLYTANAAFCQKTGQPGKVPPQRAPSVPAPGDYIDIRWSDLFSFELVGTDTLKRLVGSVELRQDSVYLFCDSALVWNSVRVEAEGNFILQHGDSTTIFSDSAIYRSDIKIAKLYGNVSMLRGLQKLFTDSLTYDVNTKIATYASGATMTDDTTYLTSVKGYYHAKTDDIFFKDSVVVTSPDFSLRSDTLQFNASSKIVTFVAPTIIVQDTARIYTEGGFYDIGKKLAEFTKNPQYVKNDQKAWAKIMRYDGNLEEVTLIGDAHFEDSTTLASAEVIRYNERTEVTVLMGNAFIRDEARTITGDTVVYDARNETYSTRGRSLVVDGSQILEANRLDYDKERDVGTAAGNVIWQDTTENLTVVCEFAEHSKKKNYLKASGGKAGRPLLIKEVDNDSLYVSADTLMSVRPPEVPRKAPDSLQVEVWDGRDSLQQADSLRLDSLYVPPAQVKKPDDDSSRIILAFHDVRIFKSDLQALCDSLSYSSVDSMFRLYQNPLIWSDTSQFSADTVLMQLANDKIDRIYLRNEAFIVNSPDEVFFNQIKGKNSTAFFEEGDVRRMRVEGNAESVYYALDDKDAYIGVNKTVCSEMLIFFGDNEVEGIRFYTEPKATLFPMKDADHEQLKLPGFSWQIERRPLSVEDLLKPGLAVPPQNPPAEKPEDVEIPPGEKAPVLDKN
jgi:lipopolysaccharide export system protein LptA